MTSPLSSTIARLRVLLESATRGKCVVIDVSAPPKRAFRIEVGGRVVARYLLFEDWKTFAHLESEPERVVANAELFAAAVNALPALLDAASECAELRAPPPSVLSTHAIERCIEIAGETYGPGDDEPWHEIAKEQLRDVLRAASPSRGFGEGVERWAAQPCEHESHIPCREIRDTPLRLLCLPCEARHVLERIASLKRPLTPAAEAGNGEKQK